jgi:hypothetical protein
MAIINAEVPAIDYTSKDYSGFLTSMLGFATSAFPIWTNQNPGGLEVMLLESLSRELDVLSYYGDRIIGESYIGTATQLSSVLQLANLLGYIPGQPVAATGTVTFQTPVAGPAVVVPTATQVTTDFISTMSAPIIFETQGTVTVPDNGGSVVVNVAQGATQGTAVFTIGNSTATPFQITTELLGTSDGSVLQEFTLANNPVVGGSVVVYIQNPLYTAGSNLDPIVPWTQVPSLQVAKSSDLVWSDSVDANGVVTIMFGDNLNGAVPAAGLNIYANYRVGGGIIGNLSSNSIIDIASPISGVTIVSSSATTGGTDAEDIDQIRVNAPKAFTTQQRAVTLQDFGNLALSIAAVSQANAVANNVSNVYLYILATGNTIPSQALLDQVTAFVQPLALAGTVVTCFPASLIRVDVGSTLSPVTITCSSRYSPSSIQTQAVQAVQALFVPSATVLGGRLSLSAVYSTLYNIPGVQYVNIPILEREDGTTSTVGDILFRPKEIATVGNIVITVSSSPF